MAKGRKESEKPGGNGLKSLEERFAKSGTSSSFPAYMRENFDRFHKLLASVGRRADKWEIVAQWAMDEKLTGNKHLKADAARRTYERERARRSKEIAPNLEQKSKGRTQPAPASSPVRILAPGPQKRPGPGGVQDKLQSLKESMKRHG